MGQVRLWNETRTGYPRDRSVVALFEEIASVHASSIAVVCEGVELTYAELNARANRLADRLRDMDVGAETIVGCCLERSIELIVALIAVLKAGAAYVPLDPGYPKERIDLILADTRPPVILVGKAFHSTILADYRGPSVFVDVNDLGSSELGDAAPEGAQNPRSLAYIMYTSGSTGRPKGVMVENRAIVRLVRNTNFCRFGPDEVFLQFAPISFDASTLEIWGPLLNGGRLVVMPPRATSLQDLGRVIREQNVTVLWLTAGLFHLMVEERLEDLRPIRQLLAGGDVLSARHVQMALDGLPNCSVINGYGPTENTTFTCCHVMQPGERVSASVPIGRPISNTQVHILDERLQPVPPGAIGELYAAGDGLARGYLNDPEATRRKFLPNPFDSEPGSRMYRTGDLARWREDGVVEFLGRTDNQVKISGHRIEPGEVEIALSKHERVRQCCVVPHIDENGTKRLAAYYISSRSCGVSAVALREFLARSLPSYMIPGFFVPVESLPLTANGKVDRSALPAPMVAVGPASQEPVATELEQMIIDIWRKYLGVERIGPTDNFFDLGGTSLLIARVHQDLQQLLCVDIPIMKLFEFTTVRSLAGRLGAGAPDSPALSAAQARAQKQRTAFANQRARRTQGL